MHTSVVAGHRMPERSKSRADPDRIIVISDVDCIWDRSIGS
jgi:hypothetical protein